MTDYRLKPNTEGRRLLINAISSLCCAGMCIAAAFAIFSHSWDEATAMFAGAILLRSFVQD